MMTSEAQALKRTFDAPSEVLVLIRREGRLGFAITTGILRGLTGRWRAELAAAGDLELKIKYAAPEERSLLKLARSALKNEIALPRDQVFWHAGNLDFDFVYDSEVREPFGPSAEELKS